MQNHETSPYDYYLRELEDAGFTPAQAEAMLSIWLDLLGKKPLRTS